MSYLLDTNVISELRRKAPDPGVVSWFAERPAVTLYISVLTLGEIRKGIESLADTAKRQQIGDWLETDVMAFFAGRILSVDEATADAWGRLLAAAGRPLPSIDSLLAAIALANDLVLVTRNTKDFIGLPLATFNPWETG